MRKIIHTALTIAGSDSGGGAGIEADLKTFSAFGVHGLVALTAVTAQNTVDVTAIHDIPPDIVYAQIKAVAEDIGVDAAKTGMLSNKDIVKTVARAVKEFSFPLVVDPVMIAKSGARLLSEDAIEALLKELLPLALVVTPNRFEAEHMLDIEIKSIEEAKIAAKEIHERFGPRGVIVKGGHISGDYAIDILFYDGKFYEFKSKRVEGCTHGTGCSFSAAITANIALGRDLVEAVKIAKEFITTAIKMSYKMGKGHCPVNPNAWIEIPAERWNVYVTLNSAVKDFIDIIEHSGQDLIPEVGTNFAYSLPKKYAKTPNDIIAIEGRLSRGVDKVVYSNKLSFGASRHLARALLKYMEFYPNIRSVLNIKYSEEIIKAAKRAGLIVSYYDRREEPEEIRAIEGATVPWGIETAIKRVEKAPDVIYHLGDWGKEPMILIFGESPEDVVKKLRKILNALRGSE